MELGDSSIDCSFILKRMLQLMWFFFLMFILKEKLINSILIKKKKMGQRTKQTFLQRRHTDG